MNVVVTGSRGFRDAALLYRAMDEIHRTRGPITRVAHGAYAGVDKLAGKWARERGIDEAPYPADWEAFGAAAGPIRNRAMLESERPDALIAFPGGAGTTDCISKARRMGIAIIVALDGEACA